MSDLDDLGFTSISDMTQDEALETLRQIRLSRRTPVKQTRQPSERKPKKAALAEVEMSPEMAAKLLSILENK